MLGNYKDSNGNIDDTWLHPFKHPNNWYRAYHGTNLVNKDNVNVPKAIYEKGFQPGFATYWLY